MLHRSYRRDTGMSAGSRRFYSTSRIEKFSPRLAIMMPEITIRHIEIDPALATLAREPSVGLIVLPDALTNVHRELIISRAARRSTIITSQIPVDKWHELIGDHTYADAILDRIVHNAQRINLTGHSLRRSSLRPTGPQIVVEGGARSLERSV
jgi:hypothetical protein